MFCFHHSHVKLGGIIPSCNSLWALRSLWKHASYDVCKFKTLTLSSWCKSLEITDSTKWPSAPVCVFKWFSTWSMERWGGYRLQILYNETQKIVGREVANIRKSELVASASWIEVVSPLFCETSFLLAELFSYRLLLDWQNKRKCS